MAPRVAKHPDVRRDEMMDAALALCVEFGYEAMKIEQVTSAVGVAKGTFYYHFGSKTDLLVATVDRWVDELFDGLEEALPQLVGTASERFRALSQLATAWKIDRLDVALAAIPLLYKPENLELRHRLFDAWTSRMRPLFLPLLEQGHVDGSFDVDDPAATTDVVLALLTDGASRLMDRALATREEDAFVDAMTRGAPALMTAAERVLGAAPGSLAIPGDYAETYRAMFAPFMAALEGGSR